jgi:hypothetical protein
MVANVVGSDTEIPAITQSSLQHAHALINTKPNDLKLIRVNRRSLELIGNSELERNLVTTAA